MPGIRIKEASVQAPRAASTLLVNSIQILELRELVNKMQFYDLWLASSRVSNKFIFSVTTAPLC